MSAPILRLVGAGGEWTSRRLPEPYDGRLLWRGPVCGLCRHVWCGRGACVCGAEFETEMRSGQHPDPEDACFDDAARRAGVRPMRVP